MTKLGDAKTLGGVGSILLLIPVVSIVGYILVLVAGKYVSDELGDESIFNNMLYAVITGIIGAAVGAFILITGALVSAFTLGISAIFGILSGVAVIWVCFIISSIFIRRAYDTMATKLGVGSFRTAGTLYLIGALLTIVIVGVVVLLVAYIVQIVAFFSINEISQPTQPQPSAAPMPQSGTRFCASCGAQVPSSSMFCPKCGAKQ